MRNKATHLFCFLLVLSVGLSDGYGQSRLTEQFLGDAEGDSFDLAYSSIMFTPNSSGTSYTLSLKSITHLPTDPAVGTNLGLGDDDWVEVEFSHLLPIRIFNRTFSTLFVGSNGYVTFTHGDSDSSQTLEEHFETLRISGLYCDLAPPHAGSVKGQYCSNRVAVTWQNVPEFGDTSPNTFQIEVFFDGRIRLSWLEINADACIVGLSNGDGLPWDFVEADFRAYLLQASEPNPEDGALHVDTWAALSWQPGNTAISHDVYVGDSYADVYNGTGGTFNGNQVTARVTLGFPGFLYPEGLVPGTTYYWRIDELESDGTVHAGDVWSFTAQEYVSIPILEEVQTLPRYEDLILPPPADGDLTVGGLARKLTLRFQGDPSAVAEPIYVVVEDFSGAVATVMHPNPAASQIGADGVWNIDLSKFVGVDLKRVREIRVGQGPEGKPSDSPKKTKIMLCELVPGIGQTDLNILVKEPGEHGKGISGAEVSVENVHDPEDTPPVSRDPIVPGMYRATVNQSRPEHPYWYTITAKKDPHGTCSKLIKIVEDIVQYPTIVLAEYTISGYVRTSGGDPIGGVSVSANNGGGSTNTSPDGYYSLEVPHEWSGTVTPSRNDYTFVPTSKVFGPVTKNQSQNFVGTLMEGNKKEYPFTGTPQDILDYGQPSDPGWSTDTWFYLDIPDAGTIADLDVMLNIDHERGSDLEVVLYGPTDFFTGPTNYVTLALPVQENLDWMDGKDTIFDDDVPPNASEVYRKPVSGHLSDFKGQSVKGEWALRITDHGPGAVGKLWSWSLIVELE